MENPNLIAGWELGAVGTHSKPPGDEEDRSLNLWMMLVMGTAHLVGDLCF